MRCRNSRLNFRGICFLAFLQAASFCDTLDIFDLATAVAQRQTTLSLPPSLLLHPLTMLQRTLPLKTLGQSTLTLWRILMKARMYPHPRPRQKHYGLVAQLWAKALPAHEPHRRHLMVQQVRTRVPPYLMGSTAYRATSHRRLCHHPRVVNAVAPAYVADRHHSCPFIRT